ncbi:MAG: helix-turn-helix transcriptional regulator, partial [Lachnospiraceae bacterium]|nr:helix-turn-helix transcriptional regulator [Lachnospiraceae bacterium]
MNTKDIGERILFLRKNKGVTQEQLAKALNITNQAVSKWESGQCLPDIQLIPEIASFFGVSIS